VEAKVSGIRLGDDRLSAMCLSLCYLFDRLGGERREIWPLKEREKTIGYSFAQGKKTDLRDPRGGGVT